MAIKIKMCFVIKTLLILRSEKSGMARPLISLHTRPQYTHVPIPSHGGIFNILYSVTLRVLLHSVKHNNTIYVCSHRTRTQYMINMIFVLQRVKKKNVMTNNWAGVDILLLRAVSTLRNADGGQRPVAGTLFGLLLLLDDTGFQIALFLRMALATDAPRQLVHAERVVYVVRVGADRLMVPGGHHHGQRHAHGHRALVVGHVRGERRGRRQAGLRQHTGAGQAGQRAQSAGAGHGVGLLVVRVAQTAVGLVVVRLVARVSAALDVPYATFFTPRNQILTVVNNYYQ